MLRSSKIVTKNSSFAFGAALLEPITPRFCLRVLLQEHVVQGTNWICPIPPDAERVHPDTTIPLLEKAHVHNAHRINGLLIRIQSVTSVRLGRNPTAINLSVWSVQMESSVPQVHAANVRLGRHQTRPSRAVTYVHMEQSQIWTNPYV